MRIRAMPFLMLCLFALLLFLSKLEAARATPFYNHSAVGERGYYEGVGFEHILNKASALVDQCLAEGKDASLCREDDFMQSMCKNGNPEACLFLGRMWSFLWLQHNNLKEGSPSAPSATEGDAQIGHKTYARAKEYFQSACYPPHFLWGCFGRGVLLLNKGHTGEAYGIFKHYCSEYGHLEACRYAWRLKLQLEPDQVLSIVRQALLEGLCGFKRDVSDPLLTEWRARHESCIDLGLEWVKDVTGSMMRVHVKSDASKKAAIKVAELLFEEPCLAGQRDACALRDSARTAQHLEQLKNLLKD